MGNEMSDVQTGIVTSHIMRALSLLATESWNTDEPSKRDHWRSTAHKAREELDELREHAAAYKRVCEMLGFADGADGRSGAHYADAKTVCTALQALLTDNEQLNSDAYERRMETGE